jgi:hypothetical protein
VVLSLEEAVNPITKLILMAIVMLALCGVAVALNDAVMGVSAGCLFGISSSGAIDLVESKWRMRR